MEGQINFSDIFKKGFLETASSVTNYTLVNITISLFVSFAIGMFIFTVYKKTFKGVLYSKNFNMSLVMISMITSMIIMTISTNIVLSLGMVGALSIVRFRTPVKDPIDLTYMFWAIASGITTGAGLYPLAMLGSMIIGLIMVGFDKVSGLENPYLLVVQCEHDQAEATVINEVQQHTQKYNLKSKTVTKDEMEMTIELRLKKKQFDFVNRVARIAGVSNAVLISYDGDYVS